MRADSGETGFGESGCGQSGRVFGFYFRVFGLHARWVGHPSAPAPSVLSEVGHFPPVREQWFAVELVAGALVAVAGWFTVAAR